MRRLVFVAGLAVGYVLGTRAGRERYEQIAKVARGIAQNPAVRQVTRSVRDTGASVASKAGGKVADRVGDRLPSSVADHLPGRARRDDEEWGGTGWSDTED